MTWHALEGDPWFPGDGSQPTSWKAKGNYSWLPWFPLPMYYEAHLLLAISRANANMAASKGGTPLDSFDKISSDEKVANKNDNS